MEGMDIRNVLEHIPQHSWGEYSWGNGPYVEERLYQGPFPQDMVNGWDVVMATTSSEEVVPGYGMGLINYVLGDLPPIVKEGETIHDTIDKIIGIPMGEKVYIRPTWRQMQSRRGALDFFDHWKITLDLAEKHRKQVGFRVMLDNPDIAEESLPDFVLEKVPMIELEGTWGKDSAQTRYRKKHRMPRYDHPFFLEALEEFDAMLAERYDGHPLIEYVDTYMYGFWGEGHTWPYHSNPFPDPATAAETWIEIFEMQRRHWRRTPLVTNTQPDFSKVGNAELVDRTIRSGNWLRTDTIFIENEQIEALGNRPPWVAAVCEVSMSDGRPETLRIQEGIPHTENVIAHVEDVGANYWSLWNWHNIHADHVMNYYRQFPRGIDMLNRRIGYRVRPSWIWRYDHGERHGLVLGLVNDGIAGVPGILRVCVTEANGKVLAGGGLDPGYPLPSGVRQARFILPPKVDWEGLVLRAELEVKGVRHPVRWACRQPLNEDGSLTLRRNLPG